MVDFRDFSINPLTVDVASADLGWLIINTNTPHELAGGEFAARREANEAVTEAMGLDYLRNALPEDLTCAGMSEREAKQCRLDLVDQTVNRALVALEETGQPHTFPRGWVRHTLHDMTLVERAAYLLGRKDAGEQVEWSELGRLFTESFVSMRDELRVSRPEIDVAVDTCLAAGALGARIVGGGFGGAVMALLPTHLLESAAERVALAYAQHGYADPEFLPMVAGFPADRDT